MDEELKPCPFCGGDAELIIGFSREVFYVECTECRAMIGRSHKEGSCLRGRLHFDNKEDAIQAWNRRV